MILSLPDYIELKTKKPEAVAMLLVVRKLIANMSFPLLFNYN